MRFPGGILDGPERELWRRADALFDRLLDEPEHTRQSRLLELTDDPALRERVRRLLAAHARSSGPLDQPPPGLPPPAAALAGQRLGRWRLEEEIGRGGMAVVYRARAEDGAEGQLAAVKVLTLGSLARDGRERFLREQQALLRLRHPYIAALYDAGVSADGTPWLAMQLVEGEPIDRWCARHRLDVPARVRLLLQVCEALDYSHRNLVVHRDIKPSNVLVDADGHVRVLDFGIARTLDGDEAATRTALHALTPEYAAPEQFTGMPPATAMDVYGAAALLYRLLTGLAPRQAVPAGEVIAPSKLLRQRAGERPDPAQRQAVARLRGDLDTILLKALAGTPEDRYPGIAAFAEDLRRWLQRRPIRAHPPSLRYRLRKFASRNRWQVAAGAVLLLLLAGGVAGTVWQMRKARAEAARANALAEESQAQLAYLESLLEMLAPGTEDTRHIDRTRVLAEATARARRELADRPQVLASVEMRLGLLAEELGEYGRAADLFDSALRRRRQLFGDESEATAEALAKSGSVRAYLSPRQPEEVLRRLEQALPVLARLAPHGQARVRALNALLAILAELDRYPQAEARLAEAMAVCDAPAAPEEACAALWANAGAFYQRTSRPKDALPHLERALETRRRLWGPEHADTLVVASRLGLVYAETGDPARGLALLEQVVQAQRRIYERPTRDALPALYMLSRLLAGSGEVERALALNSEYLDQLREVYGEDHPDSALGQTERGTLLFTEGRFAEAAAAYAEGVRIYRLVRSEAGTAIAEGNYADALREQGQAARALPLQYRSLEVLERVFGAGHPQVAARLGNVARTHAALGQHEQALRQYERTLEMYERHAREQQGGDRTAIAYVDAWRARSLLAVGRGEEAVATLRASVALLQDRPQPNPRLENEAFAFLVEAACRTGTGDCAALRAQARERLERPLPGIARLRLRQALAGGG